MKFDAITIGTLVAVFGLGGAAGAGVLAAARGKEKPAPKTVVADKDSDDDDELQSANTSLVKSLQECNRRLAEKGERAVVAPSATSVMPPPEASGRRGGRGRDPFTAPDWQKLAEEGAVPYRIPCIRSTPFVPSERQLERMGLAPQDGEVLKQAYAKSNERMMAQLVPLCTKVIGAKDVAERIGPQACMSAIIDSARKDSPDKMKAALSRVAEVNGGKRAPGEGGEPVEALMLAMSNEAKAFERDLSAQLGPEEAARIASSRGLCSERGVVRANDAPPGEGRVGRQ
jgi:hypothetical protein